VPIEQCEQETPNSLGANDKPDQNIGEEHRKCPATTPLTKTVRAIEPSPSDDDIGTVVSVTPKKSVAY
jgi:hypothetical protein